MWSPRSTRAKLGQLAYGAVIALAALPVGAAAAADSAAPSPRCTAVAHDATVAVRGLRRHDEFGLRGEFDITCNTPVAGGNLTLTLSNRTIPRTNGGAPSLAAVPREPGVVCRGAGAQPGKGYHQVACAGSLAANTPLRLYARLSPSPCARPRLKGAFTVAFGNGTSLTGMLPRYRCPPASSHRRLLRLAGVGQDGPGTAGATGFLKAPDGFHACAVHNPVFIQRLGASGWVTVGRGMSRGSENPDGWTPFFVEGMPLRGGSYRALAPARKLASGDRCLKAVSRTVTGP